MQVDLSRLVEFYDSASSAKPHSNAIKTLAGEELNLALLVRCLNERGQSVRVEKPCTGAGTWLDAWVLVDEPPVIRYQVEVKSWSFHGYGGGTPFPLHTEALVAEKIRRETWESYWDSGAGTFRPERLRKVLLPMSQYSGPSVMPLACIWAAVHPTGSSEPLFEVPCAAPYSYVTIFSASNYVRTLIAAGDATVNLPLPITEQRLTHLAQIFTPESA
jgi:hypothetical protein